MDSNLVSTNAATGTTGKKFNTFSLCAYGILASGCWTYAAVTYGTGVYAGGSPVMIYGAIGTNIIWSLFLTSMAEMASAYPSGAGLPLYARILAGDRWGPFCEYLVGTMHALGVAFTPAGALFGMIQLFATCGAMTHPEWVPQRWQLVVGYEGANILMLLLLLYAGKHLALLNRISLVGIFGGLFIVVGCLLGGSGAGSSHQFVWTKFQNDSGFASNVYCSLIALGTSLYAYGVPHWLCNLADDVERPDRAIPIALAAQQIGNGVTLFLFFVAAGYAVTDFDALLETLYPSSVGVIFDQAVQSKGGSIALILIICIPGIISFMSYNSACIYVFHGFVRTGAIPGWQWLIKIGKQGKGAANIIYVLTFINAILGLIYLGSPVGFSILLSVPGALYFSGFLVPLGAHVITSGRNLKRHGWFSLPRKVSVALAAVNILGVTFHLILVCLPREGPVTTENMNHSVLFMVFGLICALASWNFYGKRHYRGISIEVIDGLSLGRAGVSNESAKTAQDALGHGDAVDTGTALVSTAVDKKTGC